MKTARITICLITVSLLTFFVTRAMAEPYTGSRVTPLITSTKAYNGQQLAYPKTERPEVTALRIDIPPGGETGWHQHAVPVYAYVLAGSITVELADGSTFPFKEGEVILETIGLPHNGRNTGAVPVSLAVFYTGEAGKPNTLMIPKPAAPALK